VRVLGILQTVPDAPTNVEIVTRCCEAWNFFANDTATVRFITSREYTKAVRG
jgi:hypothetical protein